MYPSSDLKNLPVAAVLLLLLLLHMLGEFSSCCCITYQSPAIKSAGAPVLERKEAKKHVVSAEKRCEMLESKKEMDTSASHWVMCG